MEIEKRIEALEALVRGPTGAEREAMETHRRLYDSFKRHKIEGAPVPKLTDEEREHWEDLETYHAIAHRVADGPADGAA